jgi:hypothetical protein
MLMNANKQHDATNQENSEKQAIKQAIKQASNSKTPPTHRLTDSRYNRPQRLGSVGASNESMPKPSHTIVFKTERIIRSEDRYIPDQTKYGEARMAAGTNGIDPD